MGKDYIDNLINYNKDLKIKVSCPCCENVLDVKVPRIIVHNFTYTCDYCFEYLTISVKGDEYE